VTFGVEENPNEGYFDDLNIVKDVFMTKMKIDIANWHIGTVTTRLGKRKGSRRFSES
jgi:hypothetical protein